MNVPFISFISVSGCLPVHDIETAEPLLFLDKHQTNVSERHETHLHKEKKKKKKKKRLKTFPDLTVTSEWVDKYTQPLHRQRCPCR